MVNSKLLQDTLQWTMHESRWIVAVTWIDKCPITILSTHARLIPKDEESMTVPRRIKGVSVHVPTSLMHVEYTIYMHRMEVTSQLSGTYTC